MCPLPRVPDPKKGTLKLLSSPYKIERRARSKCGVFVQWHKPEAIILSDDAFKTAFVALPLCWTG